MHSTCTESNKWDKRETQLERQGQVRNSQLQGEREKINEKEKNGQSWREIE